MTGCYEEDGDVPFIGYEYFPTELGRFVEYRVDSIWQDDVIGQIGNAEAHYFLRDFNESAFTDEEGRPAVRVERSWKQTIQGTFSIKDIWYRTLTSKIAEQNEENVVFIKHNFPIKEGKIWDGNSKNTWQSIQEFYRQTTIPEVWDYTYMNVHQPYTVNGLTFDSTVTVLQMDRPAIFGLSMFSQEVYAKNVGLIHKQIEIYNIQQNATNPTEKDSVGFMFEMVVTDYGQ
ncbi:MAG: hypothetical protein RL266_2747 [Bacteroidota bacterium]|jgi:hypothetical protein